jgi:chromosomal replication initiator protein
MFFHVSLLSFIDASGVYTKKRQARYSMLKNIWDQFLTIAKEVVGSRVVETWFKSITFHRWDQLEKTVYLYVPNEFIRDWVQKNYQVLLSVHLGRLLHVDQPKIMLIEQGDGLSQAAGMRSHVVAKVLPAQGMLPAKSLPTRLSQNKTNALLNRQYLFDSFIVAPSNSFAYAACYAVTEKLGDLYNPLFIYGRSGLGKTHLLHAIGNAIKAQQKKLFVVYQTADRFVQEFINAIRFDTVHVFQSKYQTADVLLIDDIQCMAHKEQTQEAFFQLFSVLHDAQKQIVFSGDTFPQNMTGITERLRSRLSCGLVIDLHMPSNDAKVAILKKKAFFHNEHLPDDVAIFLAAHITSNIRELEGALTRVFAFAALTKQVVTLELAHTVLLKTVHQHADDGARADFNRILKCVTKYYKYDLDDLCSKNRNKELVLARQVTMFLMKKMTGKSLRDIGSFLGSRNHTTIKHGLFKIEEQTRRDHNFMVHLKRMQEEVLDH